MLMKHNPELGKEMSEQAQQEQIKETKEQLEAEARCVHWHNVCEQTKVYNAMLFRWCVLEAILIVILLFVVFYKR